MSKITQLWALIERQTGLERRHLDENEQWLCETSFRAGQAALAAEIERLREEPTLTITRAQYVEFVESAEDHTVLWTDTLALIGVYVAPCQTKIDV